MPFYVDLESYVFTKWCGYHVAAIFRPKGIRADAEVRISQKSGGIEYIKRGTTDKENIVVRVMPGNPNSPNQMQRTPYVVQRHGDKAIDGAGNFRTYKAKECHIPFEKYQFQDW